MNVMRNLSVLAVLAVMLCGVQAATAAYILVDDFESYTVGTFHGNSTSTTAQVSQGGPWEARDGSGVVPSTGLVELETDNPNQYITFGWNAGWRGAFRDVPDIADGAVGTYYFQVRTGDDTPDASYGLTDEAVATSAGFSDFEAQIALVDDGDGGNGLFKLIARDGGGFVDLLTGLSADTWYDAWIVANNATDKYSVYFGTTGDPETLGTLVGSALAFRNGTSDPLTAFMTLSNNHADDDARLDNIYQYVPEPASAALVIVGMVLVACCRRRHV